MPKLPIKIEIVNTYLGKTYPVYVHGMYWARLRHAPILGRSLFCFAAVIAVDRNSCMAGNSIVLQR